MATPGRALTRLAPLVAGLAAGAILTAGALALTGSRTPEGPPVPRFHEEAAAAGLVHVHDGGFGSFVGGGVAAFDCDDDGRPDLMLAGGEAPATLWRNTSAIGGELSFVRVASAVTDLVDVAGAYPLDLDGDGRIDLVVLRRGEDVVLRGLGDCRFERANETWALDGGDAWTTAFSATWEDGAASPTLALGHYLDATDIDRARCEPDVLVRGRVPGPGWQDPVVLEPGWCALSLLFSDVDPTDAGANGRRDLRVSNDRQYARGAEEQVWRLEAGRAPRLVTEADGWRRLALNGMGIASHDLTGDGRPEVYLTSQGDNKLQTLVEGATGPTYEDIAIRRGVTSHRPHAGGDALPSTSWHPSFGDVDADGHIDLHVTKGNVDAQADHAVRDPDALYLGRPDGTFVESSAAAGLLRFDSARGAALVDLNLDGMLDLVVVNRRAPATLWRNLGSGTPDAPRTLGTALMLRVRQTGPNVDAIGARIEVAAPDDAPAGTPSRWHEVTVGGGHAGGQLGWVHVGLGVERTARVRVHWPDGEVGPWHTLDAPTFQVVERGQEPRRWTPAAD